MSSPRCRRPRPRCADLAASATLWTAIGQTLEGWAIGLAIGAAAALGVGTLIGLNGFAYRSVIGVIEFFKAIPVIAILPIGLVLWGATLTMKFALVAFAVFWPLVIQVCYGVRSLDPVVRDTATVLRVTGPRKFLVVILPSAAPFIATGLRVAVAVALIVDIIAELIGGGSGIGERILLAENAGRATTRRCTPTSSSPASSACCWRGRSRWPSGTCCTGTSRSAPRRRKARTADIGTRGLTLAGHIISRPGGHGRDPGLAVRGPVRRLVVLVGGLEVAVLPAAVVDPARRCGPSGSPGLPAPSSRRPWSTCWSAT